MYGELNFNPAYLMASIKYVLIPLGYTAIIIAIIVAIINEFRKPAPSTDNIGLRAFNVELTKENQ